MTGTRTSEVLKRESSLLPGWKDKALRRKGTDVVFGNEGVGGEVHSGVEE